MNIAVIGGGASGIYYSILRKIRHPEDCVTIFEKEERIGRKLLATGNGHCNILNKSISPESFNNPNFTLNLGTIYLLAQTKTRKVFILSKYAKRRTVQVPKTYPLYTNSALRPMLTQSKELGKLCVMILQITEEIR